MKNIFKHTKCLTDLPVACMAALLLCTACTDSEADDTWEESGQNTVRVNTRSASGTGDDVAAQLFFWTEDQMNKFNTDPSLPVLPYMFQYNEQAIVTTESINYYHYDGGSLFDTGLGYPKDDSPLYATGFAPRLAAVRTEENVRNFRKLTLRPEDQAEDYNYLKGYVLGKLDFQSCDYNEAQTGKISDPFGQKENELKFRHLTSKIVFIATRDQNMMNKEGVRHVAISDLQYLTENDAWESLSAPVTFEWIANKAYGSGYGYAITSTETLNKDLKFKDASDDLVQISEERRVDSCFVCNPYSDEEEQAATGLTLRMTIKAEMIQYPLELEHKETWKEQTVQIQKVNEAGTVTDEPITRFEPGKEYHIYLNFHLTGVTLVAKEMKWNAGGIHYVPIRPENPEAGQTNI